MTMHVIRRFKRVEGLNGENGHSGAPCSSERHSGVDGRRGNVTIVVQRSDGSQQEYSSLYCLELIDFDVEDENGDGIFEPGEHLFIRRITVRNSDWFKLIDGDDGRTVLPSIMEGSNIKALATVAQASLSKLSFEVYNHGNLSIGPQGYNSRIVEIDVSFPAAFGLLESGLGQWEDTIIITPPKIRSRKSLSLERQLHIHSDAQSHQHVVVVFKLYLGRPTQLGPGGQDKVSLAHKVEIILQVSEHYHYNPGASFLLVTNSEIGRERSQSICRFINNSLGMEVDTWNVSLYAGLDYRDHDSDALKNVMFRYHGKTVIFFGNRFDFFGQGTKSIFDLCDPEALVVAAAHDTNFLFLDTPDFKPHAKLVNEMVFWPSQSIFDMEARINQSQRFHSVPDFVASLTQQRQRHSLTHARFAITIPKKWNQAGPSKPKTKAKNVATQLRRKLPTTRFIIVDHGLNVSQRPSTGIVGEDAPGLERCEHSRGCPSDVMVTIGVPYHNSIAASEQRSPSELIADMTPTDGIPAAEAYMVVEGIALHHRVDLLWGTAAGSTSNDGLARPSQFAIEALTTSLIQTTHRELKLLLDKSPWPDKILPSNPSKHSFEELKFLFASHLPALHAILFHPKALDMATAVSSNVQSVLSYALATMQPQSRRQVMTQAMTQALTPTRNRRRRAHAILKTGIATMFRKKGTAETL
ncbi:hypothetical protein F5883DRAFT_522096 [Diaporthe sp. PMI_573]|nr:hypothetical protein F5883DRAFT_522096 [Diaporthaceae sp. PMI_573]